MKIGIIVYSGTGVTLSVARVLETKLAAAGHSPVIEQILAEGLVRPVEPSFRITHSPDPAKYDAVVLASSVMAFSLNPAMAAWLKGAAGLKGKKAALFVTQGFPFAAWGGNQSLAQMRAHCESAGAAVIGTGVVNRMSFRMKAQIEEMTAKLAKLF